LAAELSCARQGPGAVWRRGERHQVTAAPPVPGLLSGLHCLSGGEQGLAAAIRVGGRSRDRRGACATAVYALVRLRIRQKVCSDRHPGCCALLTVYLCAAPRTCWTRWPSWLWLLFCAFCPRSRG